MQPDVTPYTKDAHQKGTCRKEIFMLRLIAITASIVVLTASGVCAGNFEISADAGLVKSPTPLHINSGRIIKAQFKSDMKTTMDSEFDTDDLYPGPEPASTSDTKIKPKPAVAFKERSAGMAPPQKASPGVDPTFLAGAKDEVADLDGDLEKDLVLTPPPSKSEDKTEPEKKTGSIADKKTTGTQKADVVKKADRKTEPKVKQMTPSDYGTGSYAQSPKQIRKVKPVTQNPWSMPAGNYAARHYPIDANGPACRVDDTSCGNRIRVSGATQFNTGASAGYMAPGYERAKPNLHAANRDRINRDGVTIKLAPAAAPNNMEYQEDSSSDLLGAAAEIIGLPFAFISSFF
jgi:hypothetical protein